VVPRGASSESVPCQNLRDDHYGSVSHCCSFTAFPNSSSRSSLSQGDLSILKSSYRDDTAGREGSGIVQQALDRTILGRRVAIAVKDAAWSVWVQAPIMQAVLLPSDIPLTRAACLLFNPISALGLTDMLHSKQIKSFVLSAADSICGDLIVQFCGLADIVPICLFHNMNSFSRTTTKYPHVSLHEKNWQHDLRTLCTTNCCNYFVDCIGGSFPNLINALVPEHSTILLFGCLSEKLTALKNSSMIFHVTSSNSDTGNTNQKIAS